MGIVISDAEEYALNILKNTTQNAQAELEAKDSELAEKDVAIKEKEAVIKEQEAEIEALKLKAKPHSLGFYRQRFR